MKFLKNQMASPNHDFFFKVACTFEWKMEKKENTLYLIWLMQVST